MHFPPSKLSISQNLTASFDGSICNINIVMQYFCHKFSIEKCASFKSRFFFGIFVEVALVSERAKRKKPQKYLKRKLSDSAHSCKAIYCPAK